MTKIDITKKIVDLRGRAISKGTEDWTIKLFLPDLLLAYKLEGSMKKLLLAQKIANCEDQFIELDQADISIIKGALKETKFFSDEGAMFNTLFNGQIELYLESLKEN